jgi:hypothetical protein
MRGKWLVKQLIRTKAQVKTPNGDGVIVGTMISPRGEDLVLVDHGRRGEGGVVEAMAYPLTAFRSKEMEE